MKAKIYYMCREQHDDGTWSRWELRAENEGCPGWFTEVKKVLVVEIEE